MKRLLLVLLTLLLSCGCVQTAPQDVSLNIFAASSLTEAFTELGTAFCDENPEIKINYNFAGSQLLRTQIEEGAPADVFASAIPSEITTLLEKELIAQEDIHIFAGNTMTVVISAKNSAQLFSLEDLSRPGLKLVLAAENVPAGEYAREVLQNLNSLYGNTYSAKVMANVVSNETNVRSVLTRVTLGEADAGFVYQSDVNNLDLLTIDIPAAQNIQALYPFGVLKNAPNADAAQQFVDFVLSPSGQKILRKWGFLDNQ